MSIKRVPGASVTAWTATALLLSMGCGTSGKTPPDSTAVQAALNADSVAADSMLAAFGKPKPPALPKVPFNNQPCLSLSQADLGSLGIGSDDSKADRAPATLPYDNYCTYMSNSQDVQVGYMTDMDYDTNRTGNRSTSRTAPPNLPGAFYDGQGGLWFTTKGYYVVIAGRDMYKERAAQIIIARL
jgi:hypothetical protein